MHYHDPCYYDLSQTYTSWVKLFIADLYKLKLVAGYEAGGVRFYKNHPIRWVQVVAVVVAAEVRLMGALRDVAYGELELDDGSGAVICAKLYDKVYADASIAAGSKSIDIGSLVKINGTLQHGFEQPFLKAIKVQLLTNPAIEAAAWQERLDVRRKVLDIPWQLPETHTKSSTLRHHERVLVKEEQKIAEQVDVASLEAEGQSMRLLKRQIVQHLTQRRIQVFSLRDLCNDARLTSAAEAVAQQRYGSAEDASPRMLNSCVAELVADGMLVTSQVRKGAFCTVGDWNLGPVVTAVLEQLALQGIEAVRTRDVWERVKTMGFARVSKQRVREVMESLGTEQTSVS